MHTHAESLPRERQFHAGNKRSTVRQERCAGDNPVRMRLGNAAIHAFRPAQIIRIDDQIFHSRYGPSKAGPSLYASCTFVQLLLPPRTTSVLLTHLPANFSMALLRH